MKALVVYESLYGNTADIGEAIAASLRAHGVEVDAGPISRVDPVTAGGVDLLVVGGPTHAHGMSRAATRKAALEDEKNTFAEPNAGQGLREWLSRLPAGEGRLAAAFDTRFDKPRILTGSAAKGIANRLEGHGYRLVEAPESFFVTTENQLGPGQKEHAEMWGARIAEDASASAR